MRRLTLVALALVLAVPFTAHAAPATLRPAAEGPDRAPTGTPAATVTVFDKAMFSFGLKPPTLSRTVTKRLPQAPAGGWDRVLLTFIDAPTDDEPWDRVFSVVVGKVELLRGTTPRTDMTLRKDVTHFLPSLAPGNRSFSAHVGTYTGGHRVSVRLEFYVDQDAAFPRYAGAVGAFHNIGIEPEHKDATRHKAAAKVRFGRAPKSAYLEVTTTGHLQGGEFWYLPDRGSTTPPIIHVRVNGEEIASGPVMPYVYALAGFEGANHDLHPAMWWTAQAALDQAGVHTGTGEIPPYVVELPSETVAKLTGTKTVEVTVDGKGLWITSVSFLLG